jgi:hypothetical protein
MSCTCSPRSSSNTTLSLIPRRLYNTTGNRYVSLQCKSLVHLIRIPCPHQSPGDVTSNTIQWTAGVSLDPLESLFFYFLYTWEEKRLNLCPGGIQSSVFQHGRKGNSYPPKDVPNLGWDWRLNTVLYVCEISSSHSGEYEDGCLFCRWNFRFLRRLVWRWPSSGMLRCVVWYKFTDVSEVLAASIIRAIAFMARYLAT